MKYFCQFCSALLKYNGTWRGFHHFKCAACGDETQKIRIGAEEA